MIDRHRYALSVGAFRIGLLLTSVFLLLHLIVEPRRSPYVHPVVDGMLFLLGFAAVGYVIALLIWALRSKRRNAAR